MYLCQWLQHPAIGILLGLWWIPLWLNSNIILECIRGEHIDWVEKKNCRYLSLIIDCANSQGLWCPQSSGFSWEEVLLHNFSKKMEEVYNLVIQSVHFLIRKGILKLHVLFSQALVVVDAFIHLCLRFILYWAGFVGMVA